MTGDDWTPQRLAEELLTLFPNVGRLMALYMRSLEDEEAETTLMQMRTVFFIVEHPTTVSDLARKRKVSLQAASTQVQLLVERGWVVRVPDPGDRRRSILKVTPEGIAAAESAREQMASYLAGFLGELTPEEIAAAQVFLPALQRVTQQPIGNQCP